jgi:hypothetical protein
MTAMEASMVLSSGASIAAISLAIKLMSDYGKMQKSVQLLELAAKDSVTFVRRFELDSLSKHMDQRFDSLERQMQEIRKELLHIRNA